MSLSDIEGILEGLEKDNNLRRLRVSLQDGKYVETGGRRYLNLSSNDYLGLGGDMALQKEFLECVLSEERFLMGSSASRLMTGNGPDYDELEALLAALWPGRSSLVLNSGFAVNSALLPALTTKNDIIFADKLVHASLIDGLRLCECPWQRYPHNDLERLESLIKKARSEGCTGDIWVVTESVFSMDGDRAPLKRLMELKNRYGIRIYLDEAHAFGVFGPDGHGLAAEAGMAQDIDIIVATLGKAMASAGGFAICDPLIRELLVNRMRTLIFSTGLPPIILQWSKFIIDRLSDFDSRRDHLSRLVSLLSPGDPGATHIVPVMTYDNGSAVSLAGRLRDEGYWVTPIKHPTVPQGKARVRVSLSASLSEDDILNFKSICNSIL